MAVPNTLRQLIAAIRKDRRGANAVEFALISPVFLTMLMGGFDMTRQTYLQGVLEGELQRAARKSSLESGLASAQQTKLDERVTKQVKQIAASSTLTFERKAYQDYTRLDSRKEEFIDTDGNGNCNNGETFADSNGNGSWDSDAGITGQGTAESVVIYTVTVTYPRILPLDGLLGWGKNSVIKATTLLRNQPYSAGVKSTTGTCS